MAPERGTGTLPKLALVDPSPPPPSNYWTAHLLSFSFLCFVRVGTLFGRTLCQGEARPSFITSDTDCGAALGISFYYYLERLKRGTTLLEEGVGEDDEKNIKTGPAFSVDSSISFTLRWSGADSGGRGTGNGRHTRVAG